MATSSTAELKGLSAFRAFLEMIKFEHSVFALPYALIGMMWATPGFPGWRIFVLILIAMVSCRTAAMTYNRIADRDIDAKNARTATRAIPAGLLSLRTTNLYFFGSVGLFFVAAGLLNVTTLVLSPVAIFVTVFYSRTKLFTWLCHFWLGVSLGIAPAAAWIAVTGKLALVPVLLFLAVTFWTAGFDIIYALQDEEFDKKNGLKSVPAQFGMVRALQISRGAHCASLFFLGLALSAYGVGWVGVLAGLFAAGMLIYEQSLVKPNDLSKVNLAFFTLNGCISVGVFLLLLVDHLVRR